MPDPASGLVLPDGRAATGPPPPDLEHVEGDVVDDEAPAALPAPIHAEQAGPLTPAAHSPSTALIDAASPAAMIEQATAVATALSAVIEQQGLRVNMGTQAKPRWHVEVEGWQALGTLLGCVAELDYARPWTDPATGAPDRVTYTARVEHFEGRGNQRRLARVTTYDVDGYSWEARVRIVRNGTTVGIGEALCSRQEVRWGRADDYAVKSMAITRATSRAYKQAAGWVVALAGYEATPAAEVDPHTGNPLPYGPDVSGQAAATLRRAALYLIGAADDEDFEGYEDWVTTVHGLTNGYLPDVVARAIIGLANVARQARAGDDPSATTPEDLA